MATLESQLNAHRARHSQISKVLEALASLGMQSNSSPADGQKPDEPLRAGRGIRTVDMVVTLVRDAPHGLTREEIHTSFVKRWGDSWWENPRNALNTAIGRALTRGLITKRGERLHAQ